MLVEQEIFFSSKTSRPNSGHTQLPIEWGDGGFVLRVKLPQHETVHSPSSNIEFENEWICNSALNGVYRKALASLSSPFYKENIYITKNKSRSVLADSEISQEEK